MSPGEEGRYGKELTRRSLAGCKNQCRAVNVFRRRKERKLEKTPEVLKMAIGTRKEQADADGTGAVVLCFWK